jgi:hypothetical protein
MKPALQCLPILALLVATTATTGHAAPPADRWWAEETPCLDTPLVEQASSGVQGSAQLCVSRDGIRTRVQAEHLVSGSAYTSWVVYFDNPSACASTPCKPPDALGDDPAGVVGRVDGLVANGDGAGTFAGTFRDLRLSHGAEVHLPIFGHGPASTDNNRALARQLLTPQEPGLGAPMGGAAADGTQGAAVAVAVFTIP